MEKKVKRFLEIVGGSLLVLAGVVMLATPGTGILAIVAGVMLISPHHGRRIIWWLKQFWRGLKGWWYSFRFKRVVKRKILQRAHKFRGRISQKK